MKKTILLLFFLPFICYSQNWTIKEKEQLKINRDNPKTWDKNLKNDDFNANKYFDSIKIEKQPFRYGIFPVPNYDLIGKNSFRGLGSGANFSYKIANKNLVNAFLISAKNDFSKNILKEKADEVFFNIIVLSDFYTDTNIIAENFQNNVVSRNHPDYIGQGMMKTKNDKIEFIAFLTADRRQYAIVNMRLFDLELGRTILIAPQKDGSLRSMQIKSGEIIESTRLNRYNIELLNNKKVVEFFNNPNTI